MLTNPPSPSFKGEGGIDYPKKRLIIVESNKDFKFHYLYYMRY